MAERVRNLRAGRRRISLVAMLSPKTRQRLLRTWMLLGFALFSLRFLEQGKKYARLFFGDVFGETAAPDGDGRAEVSAPPVHDLTAALRLGSWNMEYLDVPGRGRMARSARDYAALRRYADRLDADVIAVQEVASEAALAEVFSPEVYAFHLAKLGGAQRSGFVYRRTLSVTLLPDVDSLAAEQLRAGADMAIHVSGKKILRLLSIHLKAFCVEGPLTGAGADCEKLRAQVPKLEAWIDARANEGSAFAVLGDFNRVLGARDDALYAELDDRDPPSLQLKRASMRTQTRCRGGRVERAIDHVLLGGSAVSTLLSPGLVEVSYAPDDLAVHVQLSDHCPIAVSLDPGRL